MDATTVFKQVHGWRHDLYHEINALLPDLNTLAPKHLNTVTAPMLEGQPFTILLIVYDQGKPFELTPARVKLQPSGLTRSRYPVS